MLLFIQQTFRAIYVQNIVWDALRNKIDKLGESNS